jgi:hypothetical protein
MVCGLFGDRKISDEFKSRISVGEIAKREFTEHQGVGEHPILIKQIREQFVSLPEVVDPNRGINEDHLRGMLLIFGEDAPSFANLRALSAEIKAFRPSCMSKVFSLIPVSLEAFSKIASSMFNVVLMHTDMDVFAYKSTGTEQTPESVAGL